MPRSDGWTQVLSNGSIPMGVQEQEAIVIDMSGEATRPSPEGTLIAHKSEVGPWALKTSGLVDPRFHLARQASDNIDRALRNGGILIVFGSWITPQTVALGRVNSSIFDFEESVSLRPARVRLGLWEAVSALYESVDVHQVDGSHIKALPGPLQEILEAHGLEGHYACRIEADANLNGTFFPVLVTDASEIIGAVIHPADCAGRILILPHLNDKASLINSILEADIGNIFQTKPSWLDDPAYDVPGLGSVRKRAGSARTKAEAELKELLIEQSKLLEEYGFLQGLLTGQDSPLVESIKKTLNLLGFTNIVDVDAELESGEPKKEDLRVEDRTPDLLIEGTGVSGTGTEEKHLQVAKHVGPRNAIRRGSAIGLTILNHQRELPPANRVAEPFTRRVIKAADAHQVGLMTSWELFKQVGRSEIVPRHYGALGTVVKRWPKTNTIGIVMEGELSNNDRVALILPQGFVETRIVSMQVDDIDVLEAHPGDKTGVRLPQDVPLPRIGQLIYVVKR